jgi:hypothetical protein
MRGLPRIGALRFPMATVIATMSPDLVRWLSPASRIRCDPRRRLRSSADAASHGPTTPKLSELPHKVIRERNPSRADVHRNRDVIPGDRQQGWVPTEVLWPWRPSRHYRGAPQSDIIHDMGRCHDGWACYRLARRRQF